MGVGLGSAHTTQVGMRRFHLLRNHQWKPTLNIDKVGLSICSRPSPKWHC